LLQIPPLLNALLLIGLKAHCAKDFAPGTEAKSPGDAQNLAPGQEAKGPVPCVECAKDFAPGQEKSIKK
jgi:hypothetical protein